MTGIRTAGYAAQSAISGLAPFEFNHRALRTDDVHIKVKFCGICHSDIHQVRNEWHNAMYPMVPGHEMVGVVAAVGSSVTKFRVGDLAGVGVLVDSCASCPSCKGGDEQYCLKGAVLSYNFLEYDGSMTYGGYARDVVCKETFVLKIPSSLDLAAAAPLLCAGITVYSPMKHFEMCKPGMKIGVAGLGGLGHMAVKLGVAWGCEVSIISHSEHKRAEAHRLGAKKFIWSMSGKEMEDAAGSLDGIIDTVSDGKLIGRYVALLKPKAILCTVGLPPAGNDITFWPGLVIMSGKSIAGSTIGGIRETQEMLDFCAEKSIVADIELISMSEADAAFNRITKSDVKYRFVIDVENTAPQVKLD